MMGKSNLLADIDAAVVIAVAASRPVTWFDRLPTEAQDALLAARTKFHAGGYGDISRFALARVLVAYAKEHGWKTCDRKRMHEWLEKHT